MARPRDRMAMLMLRDGQQWFIFNWLVSPERQAFQPGEGIADRAWSLLGSGAVCAGPHADAYLCGEGRRRPEMVRFNPDNILWVKGDQG